MNKTNRSISGNVLRCCCAVAALVWLGSSRSASATDYYYINSGNTNWNGPTTWGPTAGPPGPGDRVLIGGTTARTLTVNVAATPNISDMVVTNTSANFTLTFSQAGVGLWITNSLIIGTGGNVGTLLLSVPSSTAGNLAVTNSFGTGQIIAGDSANGTLGGGALFTRILADQVIVGNSVNATGTLNVSVSKRSLYASNIVVGASGAGNYNLGQLTTNLVWGAGLIIGQNLGSVGTVTMNTTADGLLAVTNAAHNAQLVVGQNGAGIFTLSAGNVNLDQLVVATNAGSAGTFNWNGGIVSIGGVTDTNTLFNNIITSGTGWGQNQSVQTLGWGVGYTRFTDLSLGGAGNGTGVVLVAGGTFAVTNGGAANLAVGSVAGGATELFGPNGGTVIADHVWATNGANSVVLLKSGTLTTLGNSTLLTNSAANFDIGTNGPATWAASGGTNTISTTGNVRLGVGAGAPGFLVVSGTNTLLNVTAANVQLGLSSGAAGNAITVSNGAALVVNTATLFVGQGGNGDSKGYSTNVVTDPGSRWLINGSLSLGDNNGSIFNLMVVSNGATLTVTNTITVGTRSNFQTLSVTGTGSVLNVGTINVGWGVNVRSSFEQFTLANGATGNVYSALTMNNSSGGPTTNNSLTVDAAALFVTNAAGNATMTIGYGGTISNDATLLITNAARVLLTGNATLGNLVSATSNKVTVTGSGSRWDVTRALTLGNAGVINQLTIADSGVVTASNLVLGAAATSLGNQLTITGGSLYVTNASGNGALVVGQLGQGAVTLNSGTGSVDKLIVTNNANVNTFTFNGGTLITKGTAVTNATEFVVGNGAGAATLQPQGGTHAFANGLAITNNAILSGSGTVVSPIKNLNYLLATNGTLTLTGIISGTGSNLVSNGGTLVLQAANSYSGGTVVDGTLKVNNASGSGTGTGTVTIHNGGTLMGSGTIAGAVMIDNGATLSPGNSVGTNTVGSLTLSAGSNLHWEFNAGANDLTIVTGADGLTINGGKFSLYNESGGTDFNAPGFYKLIQYSGSIGGAGVGALSWNNNISSLTNRFAASTIGGLDYVTLRIGGGFGRSFDGQGSAFQDPGDANWTNPLNWGSDTAPQVLDRLSFATSPYGRLSVTNDFTAGTQFSGFVFSNNAPAFVLAGNRVNLEGDIVNNSSTKQTIALDLTLDTVDAGFNTAAGDIEVRGAITNTVPGLGLTKSGAHRLILSGIATYTGPTVVNAGTLSVNTTLSSGGGTVFVNAGATLGGTGFVNRAVSVAGNGRLAPGNSAGVLTVGALTLADNFVYDWELGATATDRVDATSITWTGSTWTLRLEEDGLPAPENFGLDATNNVYVLFTSGTPINSAFTNSVLVLPTASWMTTATTRVFFGPGNTEVLLSGVWLVPEPFTLMLLGCGGLVLWLRRRRG